MSVVYDYETSARDDPLVLLVIHAIDLVVGMLTPERAMILKKFPFLLNLPDWCPGSSIKRDARLSTNLSNEMVNVPFDYVKQHMVGHLLFSLLLADFDYVTLGKAENSISSRSSMVGEHLQRMEGQGEELKPVLETALKNTATTAFVGE
ncbi:hypothetical protein AZE42_08829 [Rhizopogon vesiculosus]|uniref:Uncharacterized protein n=1 Tax=Rhizopogon vesiculosus TaxID=180088 RepID=A0A1J8R1F6_9AGAM|nr:hypothetical protein AZE42_08829 [Rhizopogon vesiculosus]